MKEYELRQLLTKPKKKKEERQNYGLQQHTAEKHQCLLNIIHTSKSFAELYNPSKCLHLNS